MTSAPLSTVGPPILTLSVFIAVSCLLRPVIWPDETRYLTGAREMGVRHDFIVPTVDFDLDHQKPPLLFWLTDLALRVLGALIARLLHLRSPRRGSYLRTAGAGLAMGPGALARAPVVLIFVPRTVATCPLWRDERHGVSAVRLWLATGEAVPDALVRFAARIGPALLETGGEFGQALVWKQTAGRVGAGAPDP